MHRGVLSVRKVAVLVMNLPRGAQTWVALGGAGAVTAETEGAWLIEHALFTIAHAQGGSKGEKPEMRAYPRGLAELAANAQYTMSRAEAFRAKHHPKQE
jgi:mono/diheme cytochrome c family protein